MNQDYKKYVWIAAGAVVLVGGFLFFSQYNKQAQTPPETKPGIIVSQPLASEEVSFPLTIRGSITGLGGWIPFEGHAGTVQAIDEQGPLSEVGALLVKGEWTTLPADFMGTLGSEDTISRIKADTGYLLFKNENPSGLPENDREYRLPVKFNKE